VPSRRLPAGISCNLARPTAPQLIGTAVDPIRSVPSTLCGRHQGFQQSARWHSAQGSCPALPAAVPEPRLGDKARRQSWLTASITASATAACRHLARCRLSCRPATDAIWPATDPPPARMHRQQGVGAVTLGGAQRRRIGLSRFGAVATSCSSGRPAAGATASHGAGRHGAAVGRRPGHRPPGCCLRESFSHQPRIDGRLLPHSARPARRKPARCCPGRNRLAGFRRPGVVTVLTDDLLRVLANRRQAGTLRRLGVAGQAQPGSPGPLGRLIALFRRLAADRLR
jgi:hypothetical protein